jgi:hypothetical protein
MHDGEESDTTLIPVYHYKQYDDFIYRHYLQFTMSRDNPTYGEQCRGIKWGHESGATFPGYSTGFAAIVDAKTMNGPSGYLTELKRLNDLDGSWWWWPYKCNAPTGQVERLNVCGKCGWASGVFSTMFLSQIVGLDYDAPSKTLYWRPFSPCSNFCGKNMRIGKNSITFLYQKKSTKTILQLESNSDESITCKIEVMGDEDCLVMGDNQEKYSRRDAIFLGNPSTIIELVVQPHESYSLVFENTK